MTIIGHKKIIKLLERSIAKGRVAQAYILSGPVGVGKFTVALDFAKKLLEESAEKINPDLIIVAPEIEEIKGVFKKRDIKIEKIRDLQHRIALSSSRGNYRVVIIDDADRLNKASQNALLKTLEEPNSGLLLLLVVQDEKRILSTILSRCQKVRFGTVSRDELEKIIPSGTKEKDQMLFWSLGRPGLLLELHNNKEELNFRSDSLKSLKELFSKNIPGRFLAAEKMSKDISLVIKNLDLWMIALREGFLGREKFVNISQTRSLEIIDEIEKSLGIIKNTNSNARLVLENLFLNF